MKYHVISFGCQFNKSDSERAAAIFEQLGYEKTADLNAADLVLVFACSVRQTAIDRIYGLKQKLEAARRCRQLVAILSGCVLKSDEKKMLEFFDLIIDAKKLIKLPSELKKLNHKLVNLPTCKLANFGSVHPSYQSTFQAYVPVMTGCNNFCSYCVVPYTRGREVSRPAAEVIAECRDLIRRGYKEIILIGQNVNSYRSEISDQKTGIGKRKSENRVRNLVIDFPKLLKIIDAIPGEYWLSFATSHPKDLSDSLIKTMAASKHILPYLHLPAQSGDDQILKKMNRRYSAGHYLGLIRKAKRLIPDLAVSTDIIVGFPGETKKQFLNTAKLFVSAGYDMAYIAQYSPRSGTAAASMPDDVPKEEKKKKGKSPDSDS